MIVKFKLDAVEAHEVIQLCILGARLLKTSTKEDRKIGEDFSKNLIPKLDAQLLEQINKGGLSD